jgi:hypothetical protein
VNASRQRPRPSQRGFVVLCFVAEWSASTLGCSPSDETIAVPRETRLSDSVGCDFLDDPLEGTVAFYRFESDAGRAFVIDDARSADGAVHGGTAALVPGPEGCGQAFDFGANGERFIVLPENSAWHLQAGAIDFWLKAPPLMDVAMGLVSRDEFESYRDNLSLWIEPGGSIIARMQHLNEDGTTHEAIHCSVLQLSADTWVHVGFNFGPEGNALFVNGDAGERDGSSTIFGLTNQPCGSSNPSGLSGNDLPWVVGRSAYRSLTPLEGLEQPLLGGAIDNLRISRIRRDFTRLAGEARQ